MIPHKYSPMRWFDDVVEAATNSQEFIIIAVCFNKSECEDLIDWLETTMPEKVAVLPSKSIVVLTTLERMIEIHPAAKWNIYGNSIIAELKENNCKSFIIVATDLEMNEFAKEAPDFISQSLFMRVQSDLPALDEHNPLVEQYIAKLKGFETKHNLTTKDLMSHLEGLMNLPDSISEFEIRSWQHTAQMLRNIPTERILPKSKIYSQYSNLRYQLNILISKGCIDTPEADKVREDLMLPWSSLSEADLAELDNAAEKQLKNMLGILVEA